MLGEIQEAIFVVFFSSFKRPFLPFLKIGSRIFRTKDRTALKYESRIASSSTPASPREEIAARGGM